MGENLKHHILFNSYLKLEKKEQDIAEMLFSIPWTHHKFILDKIKGDVQKGLFFVAKAKEVYFWRATFLCWFGVLQPPAAMLCTHWPKDGQIDTSRFGANADVRELLWQAYVYAAAYQLYPLRYMGNLYRKFSFSTLGMSTV